MPLAWELIANVLAKRVCHLGPPDDIELYVQEIEQAVRDETQHTATLFVSDAEAKGDFDGYCNS